MAGTHFIWILMSKVLFACNVWKRRQTVQIGQFGRRRPNRPICAVCRLPIYAVCCFKRLLSKSASVNWTVCTRCPATLLTNFSHKKYRHAVLASLWKAACFKPMMSSRAWRILFPLFFSSRELSSINYESVLLTCVSSMITREENREKDLSCPRGHRWLEAGCFAFHRRVACFARTHIIMLHSEFCAVWLSLSDVTGKNNFAH